MSSKDKNEIGLIELLEYFKKGIKQIFEFFISVLKWILNVFVQFLILIKSNLVFISVVVILFIGIWYLVENVPAFKTYEYELLVQPNYNSKTDLFSQVRSLNDNQLLDTPFNKSIIEVRINPVDNFNEKVNAYYSTLTNEYDPNYFYNSSDDRDTIFFREVTLQDYAKEVTKRDYARFVINFKSKTQHSSEELIDKILGPITKNPTYIEFQKRYLNQVNADIEQYESSIKLIDTLLLARAKAQNQVTSDKSLNLNGDTKNNVELDLLNQKTSAINNISVLRLKQAKNSEIINVLGEPKLINPYNKVKSSITTFAFMGFVFALGLIFLKKLWDYLSEVQKSESKKA